MANKRVFVSFSSKDDSFVTKFMARLSAQPVQVWDYSREGCEIPGAARVKEYLRQRVSGSDVFIPAVTEAYVQSEYTAVEVEQALALERTGAVRILPLVVPSLGAQKQWPAPYAGLREIRHYEFAPDEPAGVETLVRRICGDLQIEYAPLPISDPRLPFMDRFVREFENRVPRHAEHLRALYCRLQGAIADFTNVFEQQRYGAALKSITYFISMCEYEHAGQRFYYPYLVRAVCLMTVGRWSEASDVLHRLMDHSMLEENAFAALGRVKQAQGRFPEALYLYEKALERNPHDEGAATGVVVNSVLSGRRLPSEAILSVIEKGKFVSPEEEQAAALFADVRRQGQLSDVDIVNYANILVDLGQRRQARDMLRQGVQHEPDNRLLLRWLARYYLEEGPQEEAVLYYKRIVALSNGSIESLYEYLLAQVAAGDSQATETAERLINAGNPGNENEFYYVGYAHWLLGHSERAEYDFERSGFGESHHYRHAKP
jgi:tetratricopeptide (TPR) repeat protein